MHFFIIYKFSFSFASDYDLFVYLLHDAQYIISVL